MSGARARLIEKWERDPVAGAVDDHVRVDNRAVCEADLLATQFGDVGLWRHGTVAKAAEQRIGYCRVRLEDFVLRLGEPVTLDRPDSDMHYPLEKELAQLPREPGRGR